MSYTSLITTTPSGRPSLIWLTGCYRMALEPPQTSTEDPIPVHIAGDKVYVYDVDSIRRLRVDHHITGITLGTLPQVAQQNVFLGVPLQLLPEEVAVLVEQRE